MEIKRRSLYFTHFKHRGKLTQLGKIGLSKGCTCMTYFTLNKFLIYISFTNKTGFISCSKSDFLATVCL